MHLLPCMQSHIDKLECQKKRSRPSTASPPVQSWEWGASYSIVPFINKIARFQLQMCNANQQSHVTEARGASGYWPQPYDNSRARWCLCSYQVIRARTWIFNTLLPAQIAELSRFVCCKLEATSIYHLSILLLLSNTTSAPQQLTNFFTHSTDLLFPQISSLGCPVGGFLAISFSATPQTVWSLN